MKYIELSAEELEALPEYSLSLPTLQTIGKRWKRNLNVGIDLPPRWVVGKYTESPLGPEYVQIIWKYVGKDPTDVTFAEHI